MNLSRSRKAMINTTCEALLEVVSAICALILPRLILTRFGSAYNGITSSITQFISCISLLKSGIGSVTRAALYKPLANKNTHEINEIVNATSRFMRKVAIIFGVSIVGFAAGYPFLVSEDFSWIFTFTLVIILSLSTFAQYFFGLTYQMVLQADQKNFIISIASIIQVILNTIVASILILCGCGIHTVKFGSAVVFLLPPLFYFIYVRKRYNLDATVPPKDELISQRWDAFGHQLANFINNNTDIIVTTIILGVREVSVYTVYHFVTQVLKKAVAAIGSGTTAAFGNMFARNEELNLKKNFEKFELLIYFITTILISTAMVMIIPFVSIYTHGISDTNYIRPTFGILVCISIYFTCIKIPYEQIVYAAGEFKNTRNGAFVEAGINIVISAILAYLIGLNGIIIGTIIALSYRTTRYHYYICKNIIKREFLSIFYRYLYSFMVIFVCVLSSKILPLSAINSYLEWIIYASICAVFSMAVATVLGFVFFRNNMTMVFRSILQILIIKRG